MQTLWLRRLVKIHDRTVHNQSPQQDRVRSFPSVFANQVIQETTHFGQRPSGERVIGLEPFGSSMLKRGLTPISQKKTLRGFGYSSPPPTTASSLLFTMPMTRLHRRFQQHLLSASVAIRHPLLHHPEPPYQRSSQAYDDSPSLRCSQTHGWADLKGVRTGLVEHFIEPGSEPPAGQVPCVFHQRNAQLIAPHKYPSHSNHHHLCTCCSLPPWLVLLGTLSSRRPGHVGWVGVSSC